MKIDNNALFPGMFPEGEGDAAAKQQTSSSPSLNQDIIERFQSLLQFYDTITPGTQDPLAQPAEGQSAEGEGGLGQWLGEQTPGWIEKGYDKLTEQKFGTGSSSEADVFSDTVGDTKFKDDENLSKLGKYGGGSTLGELEGHWHAARFGELDESAEGDWGKAYAKGYTDILGISGRIFYDVGAKDWSLTAAIGAQGKIELVGTHYEVGYSTPGINIAGHDIALNTKVNLDASVGAQGEARATVSIGKNTYVGVGAGGFAGASASLAGSADIGGMVGARGGVTAWAGVGAKASVDVGFKDGKFSFDFGAGLALGLGIEFNWGFTIDFGEIGDFILDGMKAIGGGFEDAANWIEGAAGDVVDWAAGAAEDVGEFAEDVGEAVAGAAEDVADAVGDAASDVADAIGDVFSW